MKALDKETIITAISTLIIGILIGGLLFSNSSDRVKDEHSHTTEIEETIWTCSMHPQVRKNEPGACPICGMDLIPLENSDDEVSATAVSMSPTAIQLANISTAVVGKMNAQKLIRLNGKVQADERMVVTQASHIPGRIERLLVNFTGEYVRKGETIAYLYAPELVTAQEELFEAVSIKDTQPQLYEAAKEKLRNWKLTEQQIDQLIESGKPNQNFPIQADASGYVTQKMVNPGDYIKRGEGIYELANLTRVWVLFEVYEKDMSWIRKGDQVSYEVQSLPGMSFKGTLEYVDPIIDPKTRVARARLEVNNNGQQLKPEMFVSGTVVAELPKQGNAIVVPKSAVMWTGIRSVVYVKVISDSGLQFMMREVTLGPALAETFVIASGLEEGEEIAINGAFSIDAAAQLAGKPSMMNKSGGAVMTGHKHAGMDMSKKSLNVSLKSSGMEPLMVVYATYFELKDALVNDNFKEARSLAKRLDQSIEKVEMAVFDADSHRYWMEYSEKMINQLSQEKSYRSIETLRETFHDVSDALISFTNAFYPLDQALYVQHCPMANKNNGADWLSTEKKIENPYFGAAMLTCGEVTKVIN